MTALLEKATESKFVQVVLLNGLHLVGEADNGPNAPDTFRLQKAMHLSMAKDPQSNQVSLSVGSLAPGIEGGSNVLIPMSAIAMVLEDPGEDLENGWRAAVGGVIPATAADAANVINFAERAKTLKS